MGRLLVVGVIWFAAIGLFAALLEWSAFQPPRLTAARDGVTALARQFNLARRASPAETRESWTVSRATAALRELVVDVVAEHPADARAIAEEIIAPAQGKYDEILVYVHAVDEVRDPLVRRVSWTPTTGYVLTSFK